jgi:hypothetical protein
MDSCCVHLLHSMRHINAVARYLHRIPLQCTACLCTACRTAASPTQMAQQGQLANLLLMLLLTLS